MRVLHIITDLLDGGAEAVLYRLILASKADVQHHVVVLMDMAKYGPMIKAAGVPVDALDMPRGRITIGGMIKLLGLLRRSAADVVQTWMYHGDLVGGALAKFTGHSRIAWGVHHSDLDAATMPLSTRLVVRACAVLSHVIPQRIVSCSRTGARLHREIGYSDKFSVLPNGYDTEAFKPDGSGSATLRSEWGCSPDQFIVGLVARLHPSKDHRNLLNALARVRVAWPDVRCVLVGTGCGPEDSALRIMMEEVRLPQDAVIALGQRSDVPCIMSAIDLHVLSSVSEAFPNVVAEAMACGTPCVVTDVGDAAMIVGETGWVVAPGDSEALARSIRAAREESLNDSERWQARKTECRRRIIENFDVEKMASAYRALWAQMVDGAAGRRNQHVD